MVLSTCNHNIQEVGAGDYEFKGSQGYVPKPCLKKKHQRQKGEMLSIYTESPIKFILPSLHFTNWEAETQGRKVIYPMPGFFETEMMSA